MAKWMKLALLVTGVMNMFGAVLFAPIVPQLRELNGFPNASHPLYLWIIAIWIFLFGLCYLWLGLTGRREPLFLIIGAAGKLSFSGLLALYWINGELPAQAVFGALSDLFFGIIFIVWLWQTRRDDKSFERSGGERYRQRDRDSSPYGEPS